jgi:hypothetical protein
MKNEKREIRIVFLIFSVIIALIARKLYPSALSYALVLFILFLMAIAIFSPITLRPLFKAWLEAAHVIGRFNTQVLLSIIFILFFIPTGLIKRIFGNDSMKRKFLHDSSYWEDYKLSGLTDKNRYERQF